MITAQGAMKGLLIHVGADTTNLGVVGPLFEDLSFEYIPIPMDNPYCGERRTYRDFRALNQRYGRTLADFLPADVADLPVYYDPDFDNYIYGQYLRRHPKSFTIRKLERGDIVFFVASLAPYDPKVYAERDRLRRYQIGRRNKYIIGLFTVESIAEVIAFKSSPRLAQALLSIWRAEGEKAPLNISGLESELAWLEEQKFIVREGGSYRLTRPGEAAPSGRDIVDWITGEWAKNERSGIKLLEEGRIAVLSGGISVEDVKLSYRYRRLRPLDLERFALIKGDPGRSALLKRAVRLTERCGRYGGFLLNRLGRAILSRTSDTLRGARWISESAAKLLIREITELNPELVGKLK
jgi:hypothetical protein